MNKLLTSILLVAIAFSCADRKMTNIEMEDVTVTDSQVDVRPTYNPSRTHKTDLVHTKLELRFDWEKRHVIGSAWLDITAMFYPVGTVELDAKGMEIKNVFLYKNGTNKPLQYEYDMLLMNIFLPEMISRGDTITLQIDYVAKPDELEVTGSAAIVDAKGLYFINADGRNPHRPKQIWTQGETESNSCWFPTFDSPNERMTQEIYLYVDTNLTTLSNGTLMYGAPVGNGLRMDYWKQSQSHTPYLAMLAIGEFEVIKDKWNDMEVSYYVEKEYAPYARTIFGNTPEMIEFFSKQLGVAYPWEKYAQVIVRDYVSGAMENTSAVIHGEFVYADDREILDDPQDGIIAHELYHHWFGDLVTCESWANLPLNESFATYGEYLWFEHKSGREEADYGLHQDLRAYMNEFKRGKAVNMIRFNYEDKEDMFDSHSYAKGGRILHMLRSYTGDEAFFTSLRNYLEDNAYGVAEIHHLRLAFEKVTGEDMNWFFDQWFLSAGHPVLDISYAWDEEKKEQLITISQKQDLEKFPLYRLPIFVDLYSNGQRSRHRITVEKGTETFRIPAPFQPEWVNVDAEKQLLCEKTDNKTNAQWVMQYDQGALYYDRREALEALLATNDSNTTSLIVGKAIYDKHASIRKLALDYLPKISKEKREFYKDIVREMAETDPESYIRAKCVELLWDVFEFRDIDFYSERMQDRSYTLAGAGFEYMYKLAPESTLGQARSLGNSVRGDLQYSLADIYSEAAERQDHEYFKYKLLSEGGFSSGRILQSYTTYLIRMNDMDMISEGAQNIQEIAYIGQPWYLRLGAMRAMATLRSTCSDRKNTNKDYEMAEARISQMMYEVIEQEKHPSLQKYYKAYQSK